MGVLGRIVGRIAGPRVDLELRYFDGVLREEFIALDSRRERLGRRGPVVRLLPTDMVGPAPRLGNRPAVPHAVPAEPDRDRMRPRPIPCDATGLALSGGGIRSAATCLGALQALQAHDRLDAFDYLSTVSGGGYIGASLTASMSPSGGAAFPFGTGVEDAPAVGHLRNVSNYLLPRGRTSLRNGAEVAAILLRGILANLVVVAAFVFAAALLTRASYPRAEALSSGSPIIRFVAAAAARFRPFEISGVLATPFIATATAGAALCLVLIVWALARSGGRLLPASSDTKGGFLSLACWLLVATGVLALVEVQPFAIKAILRIAADPSGTWRHWTIDVKWAWGALAAFSTAVATFADRIGHFLKATERSSGVAMLTARFAAKAAVLIAACILPLSVWAAYLVVSGGLIEPPGAVALDGQGRVMASPLPPTLAPLADPRICGGLWLLGTIVSVLFGANSYSLHRFYRDRLSAAFLIPPPQAAPGASLDRLKLSDLREGRGPYPILNAALNVQGSAQANQRGRNADFFVFTPHFVGSDLTFYAHTAPAEARHTGVETLDPALDLATAMAISGAAVSANMGTGTVRSLSPTLALLNVRLGYWLRNPRAAGASSRRRRIWSTVKRRVFGKLYLFLEMVNRLDETGDDILLTDGGHVENLGLYELLKRGCRTIVVVDAEADPTLAFPSLMQLQRYARIDFGVRIDLPWEAIAATARVTAAALEKGESPCHPGPHCAVGRIVYADGSVGMLIYVKSSVTGDEKDYVLDYKRRNPDFPHETTGDQFFSEEQFEMYRALGFHMVDGFFKRSSRFHHAFEGWDDYDVFQAIDAALPRGAAKGAATPEEPAAA